MSKLFQSIKLNKGFTLIELLIVIGILGVLAATLLLTLNPAAAQQKARDQQRLKDMATLQTAIDQYINDGGTAPAAPVWSAAAGTVRSNNVAATDTISTAPQPCNANWLGVNLCSYLKTVPVDPLNGRSSSCAISQTQQIANCVMRYDFRVNGVGSIEYEFRTHLESPTNYTKITNDNGDDNGNTAATSYYEVFSGVNSVL